MLHEIAVKVIDILVWVENLPPWVGIWGVLGFLALIIFGNPNTKSRIILIGLIILYGPVVWTVLPFALLGRFFDRKKRERMARNGFYNNGV